MHERRTPTRIFEGMDANVCKLNPKKYRLHIKSMGDYTVCPRKINKLSVYNARKASAQSYGVRTVVY